jgi:hypothetical protein
MGREIMAALKRFQVGSDGDGVTVGGALVVSGATTLTTVSATVVQSDTVSEKTSAAGVTIDGVLLKDNGVVTGAGTVSAPVYSTTGDTNTGIFFPAADTIAFAEGGAEAMRINSSGNVGIGTSLPDVKLHVDGTDTQYIRVSSSTHSNFAQTFATNGSTGVEYKSVYRFVDTDAGERMRIDSAGNVLVGTTTAPNIAGAIHVSNASGHGLQITNTTGNKNRRIYMASTGQLYFWNGTNEGFLSDAGAWTNASDARLKTNGRDIEYGLVTVLETQPRHFERVDAEGTHIGFVAQELQEIIPEVVSGDPERQLGVDYGSLVAVAFKAIQELSAKNDALEARIAALENSTSESPDQPE